MRCDCDRRLGVQRLGRAGVAGALVALALAPAEVLAQPAGAAPSAAAAPLPGLVVRRAPEATGCPDAPALAAAVAEHMGHPALDPVAADWRPAIEVAITRDGAAFSATVSLAGRERLLSDPGPGCAGLGDALAVTLAILLDAEAPRVLRAPHREPQPAAPPPRAPAPPPRPDARVALSAEAAFTYGLLGAAARPAFGAHVEVRVVGPLWVAPGLLWAPARSIDFPPGTVDVSLGAGTLRACVAALGGAGQGPSLSACVEPAVGALRGTGTGYASNDTGTRLWASVGLGLVARGPILGPVGWTAHVTGAALAGRREQFDVQGVTGIAYDPSPAWLSVGAGLRVALF